MIQRNTAMNYGCIPGGSKQASRIFYGTANAAMLSGEDTSELLNELVGLGINAFDTARGYGFAEHVLGNWMQAQGNRSELVILSKCGDLKNGVLHLNRKVIEEELEQSLRELRTDYIDIFLLHRDDPNTPIYEYIDCLNEAKQSGKIRAFGVSNWTIARIEEANAYARENGLEGFTVSSPHFGLAEQVSDPWGGGCITISGNTRGADRAWYQQNQMPVISYSSLSRGFFSGKFKAYDWDTAKAVLDGPAQKGYLSENNMDRLHRAEILAKRDGCTVAQIALRYIFSVGINLFAVISTQSIQRMHDNIDASNTPLRAEDIAYLEGND